MNADQRWSSRRLWNPTPPTCWQVFWVSQIASDPRRYWRKSIWGGGLAARNSPQSSVVSPQQKQLQKTFAADQLQINTDLLGDCGTPPHPLAGRCFECHKSRLTRVITGENQSWVGDLLLVAVLSPQLSVLSKSNRKRLRRRWTQINADFEKIWGPTCWRVFWVS